MNSERIHSEGPMSAFMALRTMKHEKYKYQKNTRIRMKCGWRRFMKDYQGEGRKSALWADPATPCKSSNARLFGEGFWLVSSWMKDAQKNRRIICGHMGIVETADLFSLHQQKPRTSFLVR
jgi:hypothetical protein